jgi:hypothetical protein
MILSSKKSSLEVGSDSSFSRQNFLNGGTLSSLDDMDQSNRGRLASDLESHAVSVIIKLGTLRQCLVLA